MYVLVLVVAILVPTASPELIEAVLSGDTEDVRALLQAGADVNAEDEDGSRALSLAAKSGHAEVAAVLLEFGAEVDAQTETDVTALMLAARQGNPDTIKVLIDGGADVNIETKYGGNALRIATMEDHLQTTAILLEAGASTDKVEGQETLLTKVIRAQLDDRATRMIETGEKVTAYALVVAAREGSATIRQFLRNPELFLESSSRQRPEAIPVGGTVRPPNKIKDEAPTYPDNAKKGWVQGTVILEATIDTEGNVVELEILESIPELDKAARDAVQQWKYEPTFVDGVAVPIRMTVTVSFALSRR